MKNSSIFVSYDLDIFQEHRPVILQNIPQFSFLGCFKQCFLMWLAANFLLEKGRGWGLLFRRPFLGPHLDVLHHPLLGIPSLLASSFLLRMQLRCLHALGLWAGATWCGSHILIWHLYPGAPARRRLTGSAQAVSSRGPGKKRWGQFPRLQQNRGRSPLPPTPCHSHHGIFLISLFRK